MAALPKSRVRRATIHLPADDVMPDTIRGYGYRALCDCGWQSRALRSYAEARKASRFHRLYHEATPQASLSGPL